ncbi:MAG: hypothetical protein ABII82_08770 [Verrucomicrobiota bacterium]
MLSRLDDATLRELARETDGVYTDASQWVDIAALIESTVDQGRAGEFKETGRVRLAERYQWALAPALLLLLWAFWREFPVRIDSAPVGRLRGTAAHLIAVLLALQPLSPPARADTAPTLPELAATLAQKPALTAADYAEFARTTLAHGQTLRAQGQATPAGIVDDGLAAVDAGRLLDPKAAQWDDLQESLQAQRQKPPEPPPSQDQQQQQQQPGQSEEDSEQKPSDQPDSDNPSDTNSGEQNDSAGEKGDSSDQGSASPSDQPSDQASGQDRSAPDEQADSEKKPGQSAFGDLDEPTPSDKTPASPQPSPEAGEPARQPSPEPGETQRVGGAATGQPLTDDPELMQTLQRLEQLKSQDSPARLFQLLQDPNDQPAPPAGQTW